MGVRHGGCKRPVGFWDDIQDAAARPVPSLAAPAPAFLMGSQDSSESLVPEWEGLLDPRQARGSLFAGPLLPAGSSCLCFFLAETGSARDLEAENFLCLSFFL